MLSECVIIILVVILFIAVCKMKYRQQRCSNISHNQKLSMNIEHLPPSLILSGGFQKPIVISNNTGICTTISIIQSIMNSDALCQKYIDDANRFPLYPKFTSDMSIFGMVTIANIMISNPLRITADDRLSFANRVLGDSAPTTFEELKYDNR